METNFNMDKKAILELLGVDTIIAILVMINLNEALKWLEVLLVATGIIYNVVKIINSTRKK